IACAVAGAFLIVRSPYGIRPLQRGEEDAPPTRAGPSRLPPPRPPPPPPPPLLLPRRAAGYRRFRGGEAVAASGGSGPRIGGETRRSSALAEELGEGGGGGGSGGTTNTAVVVTTADATALARGPGGSDGLSRVSGVGRRAESQGDGRGRRNGGAGDWGDGGFRGGAARAGKGGKREAVNGGGRAMAATPTFHMLRVRKRNGEGERQGSDSPQLEFLGGGDGGGERYIGTGAVLPKALRELRGVRDGAVGQRQRHPPRSHRPPPGEGTRGLHVYPAGDHYRDSGEGNAESPQPSADTPLAVRVEAQRGALFRLVLVPQRSQRELSRVAGGWPWWCWPRPQRSRRSPFGLRGQGHESGRPWQARHHGDCGVVASVLLLPPCALPDEDGSSRSETRADSQRSYGEVLLSPANDDVRDTGRRNVRPTRGTTRNIFPYPRAGQGVPRTRGGELQAIHAAVSGGGGKGERPPTLLEGHGDARPAPPGSLRGPTGEMVQGVSPITADSCRGVFGDVRRLHRHPQPGGQAHRTAAVRLFLRLQAPARQRPVRATPPGAVRRGRKVPKDARGPASVAGVVLATQRAPLSAPRTGDAVG
ncbi:unnamed protein product, partial [Ectocarpus sp. 6 AP-2014]